MGKKQINFFIENHSDQMKVPRSRNTTFLRHKKKELSFSTNKSVPNSRMMFSSIFVYMTLSVQVIDTTSWKCPMSKEEQLLHHKVHNSRRT